ncbi:MAG: ABC transporter permease [Synergistaceae bacterium]|nr:ABC transporter permease [Synergistaceae bacterium]
MVKYVLKRILYLIPVLAGVALIVFTLLYITPGDPAKMMLGERAGEEALRQFRQENGLDRPFFIQFGNFLLKAVTRGDVGKSYITKRPVTEEIMEAFPQTLKLAGYSMLIALCVGIPFGIISAIKQYSMFDTTVIILAMIGISMPAFWLGLLLILLFSVNLGWLPSSGFESFRAMILPSVTLSTGSIAMLTRMTRSCMLEVVRQDYIRTARTKGQKERVVIVKHALGNALIPVITVSGLQFGYLLGGAMLTETIFSIPGVGRLMVNAIMMRDFPVVQGGVLFVALAFSVVNLLVDLLYGYVDPRIRADYK